MVMGFWDIFSDFFNKKAKQNSEPDQTKISEEKQKSETDIHISKVRSLATGEHNANEPENSQTDAGTETNQAEPEAEDLPATLSSKRFVIYGCRKLGPSGGSEIDYKQLKIGKAAREPRDNHDKIFSNPSCLKSEITHSEKDTPGFDVAIQRITETGHELGANTSSVESRTSFKNDAQAFLPVVIDLETEFPEQKWEGKQK